jgi:arylsulfatase A-like enzyme
MKIVNRWPLLVFIASIIVLAIKVASAQNESSPNFLLLIGDDMAVETLNCYGVGADTAHTPNIDRLCEQGVRFDRFWAQPVCSPTRATMLTGQFGFRNGVGTPAGTPTNIDWAVPEANADYPDIGRAGQGRGADGPNGGAANRRAGVNNAAGENARARPNAGNRQANAASRPSLRADAWTMLQALKLDEDAGYATAAVGKWHLANDENGGLGHPNRVGFDYYAGGIKAAVENYYGWSKVVDGADPIGKTGYATTDIIDDGIAWLNERGEEPWFLWVAFNAPHTPIQLPPTELLRSEASLALKADGSNGDLHAYYNAMIEAMDTEIGRLLENIGDEVLANTHIIFMGDNGTPGNVTMPPFDRGRSKGTVYQGGVNVPLIVKGPGFESGSNAEFANSVDMFATILELAGSDAASTLPTGVVIDSVSMVPILSGGASLREFNYADHFGATRNGNSDERAMRTERFKLVQDFGNDTEELFDLVEDPYEKQNLLDGSLTEEANQSYHNLKMRLADLEVPD